jgi:hypothetical protein
MFVVHEETLMCILHVMQLCMLRTQYIDRRVDFAPTA